ncbi:hypothetical protein [Methanobrevibacter sp.]|uniref:hypothetical protein n=1 Tax=Methanobrevibacter sp. TaxID=66852 RepID=UPI003890637A
MDFDISRVYTAVNADELKVGDKVYVAFTLDDLKFAVESDSEDVEYIACIDKCNFEYRFCVSNGEQCGKVYPLTYLVERAVEKKYRPFNDCEELIETWKKKVNISPKFGTMPLIWIRNKEFESSHCITSFFQDRVSMMMPKAVVKDMYDLFNFFEFLDGTPCGVKE